MTGGKTRIDRVAILGGGNLGGAIARGFAASGFVEAGNVAVTRRRVELLEDLAAEGFRTLSDNREAIDGADVVILCVQPQQMEDLLEGVAPTLDTRKQVVISTATGVAIADIRRWVGSEIPVLRAMPNLGIAIGESMTCLAADEASTEAVPVARTVFDVMGSTLLIREDQMTSATALCACGIAFFLRAIPRRVTGRDRDRLPRRGGAPARVPDGEGGCRAAALEPQSPRDGDRQGDHPSGVHHIRPERDGESGVQLGDGPGHHPLRRQGGRALPIRGVKGHPRSRRLRSAVAFMAATITVAPPRHEP